MLKHCVISFELFVLTGLDLANSSANNVLIIDPLFLHHLSTSAPLLLSTIVQPVKMKWACALQPCDRPALQAHHGGCEQCNRHFCAEHLGSEFHSCPTMEVISSSVDGKLASTTSDCDDRISNQYSLLETPSSSAT